MTSRSCRACQSQLDAGARFCAVCGHPTSTVPSESELRPITVLFCDVIESTALSERLDPEDWHDLLTSYHQACAEVIARFQGRVSQFLGDGIMAYFGHPIAHEDDAVRAVRSALEIVEVLKHINQGIGRRLSAELRVRAGIHTGDVVLGDSGVAGDRLAIGKSINLASRIQSLAGADMIVLSQSTAQLVEGYFELRSLGAQALRGFSWPVELFQVVRATAVRSRLDAAHSRLTPYVGRASELSDLVRLWQQVELGRTSAVVVRGEAGIGKSRLVRQFKDVAMQHGGRIVECLCSPLGQATALGPVVEMLNARISEHIASDPSPVAKLEALREMLGAHSRLGRDALPLLAQTLSIPGADESVLADMSPVRRRARTLEVMRAWLCSSAERVPVTLLMEDVHWADPSTLELIDQIVRDRTSGRTLLIVTSRPEFPLRWSESDVTIIDLRRFEVPEIEAFMTHLAGGRSLPPLVARRIAERSEGVPLFIEEVTKAVLESGALRPEGNRYGVVGVLDERVLPSTIQGSLLARFDRLGSSRGVAQLGAAIGRDFSYSVLSSVAQLPEAELREHLDRLGQSELVLVQGTPPNARYTFRHALIQDAIYATLLRSDRIRVHERLFTTLVEKFPEVVADRPEMAAYHAESAGRTEAAVPLLREAGLKALARTAVVEAVKHLAHAVEIVDVLREPLRTETEIELQAALGPAYMATVGWAAPEVERSSARLRDLAAARGDGARLFQAMWGLWTVYFIRGELDLALDVAQQVRTMALGTTDRALWVAGHHALGYTRFYRGEYTQSIAHTTDGLALFELEQEKKIAQAFQLSPSTGMWCYRAQSQQMLGNFADASAAVRACEDLARDLGHPPSQAFLLNLCYCSWTVGNVEEIRARAGAARALCVIEGFAFWVLVADIFLAWVDAHEGGDAAALAERIEVARKQLHDGGTHIAETEFATLHAQVLLLAGRSEDVIRVATEALAVVQRGNQLHGEPELYRVQAEAIGASDRARALELYRRAIDRAHAQEARLFELRALLGLGELAGVAAVRDELTALAAMFPVDVRQPESVRARRLLGNPQP